MRNPLAPSRLFWVVHVPCLAEHNEAALQSFASLSNEDIAEMAMSGRFTSTHQGRDLTMADLDPDDLQVTAVFASEGDPTIAEDAARRFLINEASRARLVLKGRLIDSVAEVLDSL